MFKCCDTFPVDFLCVMQMWCVVTK